MKHRLLICAVLVLLAILAAVIFDRAWLAEKELPVEAEDASLRVFPAVLEAQGYFEEIEAPAPTPTSAVKVTEEPKPAVEIDDGYGADYIYAAVSNGAEGGNHKVKFNIAHDVRLTAYCSCEICCGYWATVRPVDEYGNQIVYTSTGARAVQGITVAVDPEWIPHGSYVYVQDPFTGAWLEYRATDTSPETNHVDIYFEDHAAALQSGYGGSGIVYWTAEPVDMETLA